MKLLYGIILLFVETLIAATVFRVFCSKGKNPSLSQKMLDLLVAAFFTVLPNVFIPFASKKILAMIFFSWYFCAIDILLFLLLHFSAEYAFPKSVSEKSFKDVFFHFFSHDFAAFFKKEKQSTTAFEKILLSIFLLIILDIISFAFNLKSGYVFSVEQIFYDGTFFSSDKYFRIVSYFPYELHLSLSYVMVLLTFILLFAKAFQAESFYKTKYLSAIFLIFFVVFVNSFYVMFELPVDFSVIFYGLVCVFLYYFSFDFIPRYLCKKSIHTAIQNMQNGILIFDNEDKCIFANDYIKKIYEIKKEEDVEKILPSIVSELSLGKKLSSCESFERTIKSEVFGEDIFYRQSFAPLYNKKNQVLGSYFLLVDTTEENLREKKERYKNTHDALTGLYNKEYFFEKVSEMLEKNPQKKYCVLCSDIGNFKLINELNGVAGGDKVLKMIAHTLRQKALPCEVYARIENDRFAMLLPKERLDLKIFIDAIEKIFRSTLDFAVMPVCYFGIYEIEDANMRVSFMCDRAFIAINSIKGQSGKQVAWYDGTLRNAVLRERELSYQLAQAISEDQIKIFLQPQSTKDGQAVGAEALVRWQHPEEGLVSPAQFIPIFEKDGMITKIDRHVWHLVFKKLAQWKKANREDMYISVNISPKDFYLMNIYQEFSDLLSEHDINPKSLHIEITEAVMMTDLERQIALISELKKLGFVIEIGDFGAGYSSLKILRDCDIEILKFDMEFLASTRTSRNAYIIMKQFVTMAHDLGTKVVAKGVMEKEQMELLSNYGCDLFQGYYFSKPIDAEMFDKIYL